MDRVIEPQNGRFPNLFLLKSFELSDVRAVKVGLIRATLMTSIQVLDKTKNKIEHKKLPKMQQLRLQFPNVPYFALPSGQKA